MACDAAYDGSIGSRLRTRRLPCFAAMILLGTACCWSAKATAADEICGPDPAVLTPLYPISTPSSGPRLGTRPEITFTFEGRKPCASNTCAITIRHGGSKKLIATIRLDSDEITYCRTSDPFQRLNPMAGDDGPGDCRGGIYASSRSVKFKAGAASSDTGVGIEWFQNRRPGRYSAFQCIGPSSGDWDVFKGRLKRFRTQKGSLLTIFEPIRLGQPDATKSFRN
jgi:hypothetical protein